MSAQGGGAGAAGVGSVGFGRVLLLTAGVGAGHLRAAQAIRSALRQGVDRGAWGAEAIELVDVLDLASGPFRAAYRDGYLEVIRHAPNLLGWLYERSDAPWRGGAARSVVNRVGLRRLRSFLRQWKPDLIVSTHFLSSEFVAWLRRRGEIQARLVTVVTDMDVHGLWFVRPCERFLVATAESAEILIAAGVERGAVEVTGIPIDPCFADLPSRSAARSALAASGEGHAACILCDDRKALAAGRVPAVSHARHTLMDLPRDRPLVLLASGGVGTGRLEEIFAQLLRISTPVHIVAICGRNARAERALREILRSEQGRDGPSAQVLGFTDRMHEWMAAADLLVGKPGGLTSSEARAAGLPMLIVDPVPGQEERNADHLLEWGVAWRANTRSTLGWKVDRLLRDGEAMDLLRRRALQHARPRSASHACEALLAVHRA